MARSNTDRATGRRILRFPQVKERVPYSRMHIDRLEKAGKFPQRIKLGDNAVGWFESEIDAWVEAKAAQRSVPTSNANNTAEIAA